MARGINKAIVVGNLGADPVMHNTGDGKAIANVSIATSEVWKDKQTGEKQEKTEWHRAVAFGPLAEVIGKYLKKGSLVYVEGSLQTRSYDKDGITRYSTEIKIRDMQMLGGATNAGAVNAGAPAAAPQPAAAAPPAPAAQQGVLEDDDIPF